MGRLDGETPGDLSAGPLWGAASAFLIAAGRDVQPLDDRYSWGVGGGLIGLGLATFALTRSSMDDGDATLAHSGGGLGMLLGGAIEYLYRGSTTEKTPSTGLGYGSAIGVVAAGVLASQVSVSPQRVLLVDVGAGGGALIGAAAASPLIVLQNQNAANTRAWISVTLAGSAVGAVGTAWLTRGLAPSKASWRYGTPSVGVIGESLTRNGSSPVMGLAWSGAF